MHDRFNSPLLCCSFQVALNTREKGSVFKGQFQLAPRVQVDSVPRMHQQPVGLAIAPLHLSLKALFVRSRKSEIGVQGRQTNLLRIEGDALFEDANVISWVDSLLLFGAILRSLDESRSHSQPRPNCQAGGAPPPSLTP